MDVRARDLLAKIREIPATSNAIIAGGAARDDILNVEPSDYDIFIPAGSGGAITERVLDGISLKSVGRDYHSDVIKGIWDFNYEGLKCQLIATFLKNDEEFPRKVVDDFDYGLCMIWFDGSAVLKDTQEFRDDNYKGVMTLRKLSSFDRLPKAIRRFDKINSKFNNRFLFRCPLLKLEQPKKEKHHSENPFTIPIDAGLNVGLEIRDWANIVRGQAPAGAGMIGPPPAEGIVEPGVGLDEWNFPDDWDDGVDED